MLLVLVKNEGVKRVLHSDLPVLESSARLVVKRRAEEGLGLQEKERGHGHDRQRRQDRATFCPSACNLRGEGCR